MNELEKKVNQQNLVYRKQNKALILKIPTPLFLTKKGIIPQSSTVDFTGIIQGGKFIAFDAKECSNKTNFPLKNIHQHQQEYLKIVKQLGGIAFYLVHMKLLFPDKYFILSPDFIDTYTDRKSIPVRDLKDDWLTTIDYLEKACVLLA